MPRRVLVVEDSDDCSWSLSAFLRRHGYLVNVAPDGPSAVEMVQADPPDAVILDIVLPGLDGWEVAQRLRAMCGDGLLIVALTCFDRQKDRMRSMEAGCNYHLVKPTEPRMLLELLDAHACQAARMNDAALRARRLFGACQARACSVDH